MSFLLKEEKYISINMYVLFKNIINIRRQRIINYINEIMIFNVSSFSLDSFATSFKLCKQNILFSVYY